MNTVKKNKTALLLVIPCLVLYLFVQVVPLAKSAYYSFFAWKGVGEMKPVGFANFIKLFTKDDVMMVALRNTLLFAGISLVFFLLLSFMSAYSLTQGVKFARAYSTILYAPGVISTVVIALMWSAIFNADTGPINLILRSLGLNSWAKVWLGDPKTAIYVIIFVNLWQWMGYHMLIFFTSLQAIPDELYEAASIDGASGRQRLFHITIPLMKSSIKMNAMLIIIGVFKCFDIVYTMTSGGPADSTQMLATYMYHNTFRRFNFGYGSAISIVIFLMSIFVSVVLQRIKFGDEDIQY